MISFRAEEATRTVIKELVSLHKARNRTAYIRGLIYLDAVLIGYPTWNLDRPSWLTKAFTLDEQEQTVRNRKRLSSVTSSSSEVPPKQAKIIHKLDRGVPDAKSKGKGKGDNSA